MKEFSGFVCADGALFENNDDAWKHEDKLFAARIAEVSASRLMSWMVAASPALHAQIRSEVLRQISVGTDK